MDIVSKIFTFFGHSYPLIFTDFYLFYPSYFTSFIIFVKIWDMEYFDRKIDRYLLEWKDDANHKPLLLRGARQVGKSSAVRQLGKSFSYFVEVNFERDSEVKSIFKGSLKPDEIVSRLSVLYGIPIIPKKTLLFFDEIQACPEALHSLWFFYENLPSLHVIAAGSLLEFALRKMESYGVGRVRSLFMYPLSFDEFLCASGNKSWAEAKQGASPSQPLYDTLHEKLIERYREFLLVGGMPESVKEWVSTHDFLRCQRVQDDIIITYEDDFSKYEQRIEPHLLRQTLHSIVKQIGRKFVFSDVGKDYRTEKIKWSLSLLADAGLIIPVIHSASNGIPLGAEINEKFIKYLFIDSGLLLRLLSIEDAGEAIRRTHEILTEVASSLVNKGSISEMVTGLELLKYGTPTRRDNLYYWQDLAPGRQAEVDYVTVRNMQVIPIEVKAGLKGAMKSMYQFLDAKHLSRGIRTSLENFGKLEKLDIVPLYAISNIS